MGLKTDQVLRLHITMRQPVFEGPVSVTQPRFRETLQAVESGGGSAGYAVFDCQNFRNEIYP